MRKLTRRIAGCVLALVGAIGCYPDQYDDYLYESVLTLYDTTAVFNTAATFALADSVVHLVPPGESDDVTRDYDQVILDRIRFNMTNAGYTEVANPTTAALNLVTLATSSTYLGVYWEDWCSYWSWWYVSWGCGYPGYWYTYEYTTGTLLIGMADNRAYANNEAPLIWFAGMNGLLGGATSALITTVIDEAFAQSPYIRYP
jgi:hypothetical protein